MQLVLCLPYVLNLSEFSCRFYKNAKKKGTWYLRAFQSQWQNIKYKVTYLK